MKKANTLTVNSVSKTKKPKTFEVKISYTKCVVKEEIVQVTEEQYNKLKNSDPYNVFEDFLAIKKLVNWNDDMAGWCGDRMENVDIDKDNLELSEENIDAE